MLIDFLLRPINLSKGPVSFPIISIVKMARKRVLQEISTPIKMYKQLSVKLWVITPKSVL